MRQQILQHNVWSANRLQAQSAEKREETPGCASKKGQEIDAPKSLRVANKANATDSTSRSRE